MVELKEEKKKKKREAQSNEHRNFTVNYYGKRNYASICTVFDMRDCFIKISSTITTS